jgi:hypothetical protein
MRLYRMGVDLQYIEEIIEARTRHVIEKYEIIADRTSKGDGTG